jgi:hypothetical protein
MNLAVVYCYPLVKSGTYYPLAQRFCDTWRKFPPHIAHSLHVITNGGPSHETDRRPFAGIPAEFHARNNFGWDIGAYQWAAENISADLMVFLGAPVHFHRAGWLERMVDAYVNNGIGLYGCWAYLSPNWHVRTTCFWCHPELLRSYPFVVGSDKRSRYTFEHGNQSFTRHILSAGLECVMVTWDGCFPFEDWHDHAPMGKQSLVFDQFTHP